MAAGSSCFMSGNPSTVAFVSLKGLITGCLLLQFFELMFWHWKEVCGMDAFHIYFSCWTLVLCEVGSRKSVRKRHIFAWLVADLVVILQQTA